MASTSLNPDGLGARWLSCPGRSCLLPCSTHIAEPDVTLDQLPRPQSGFAEAAAAGSFEPNDVPVSQHHVRDFGAQRLLLTVADQIKRAWRRGLSAGETERTELEAIEIGRKLRHRAIDPPFAPEARARRDAGRHRPVSVSNP